MTQAKNKMKKIILIGLYIILVTIIGCSDKVEPTEFVQTKWCLHNQTEDTEGCIFISKDCKNPRMAMGGNAIRCDPVS